MGPSERHCLGPARLLELPAALLRGVGPPCFSSRTPRAQGMGKS